VAAGGRADRLRIGYIFVGSSLAIKMFTLKPGKGGVSNGSATNSFLNPCCSSIGHISQFRVADFAFLLWVGRYVWCVPSVTLIKCIGNKFFCDCPVFLALRNQIL
jgi:hypothetical protein